MKTINLGIVGTGIAARELHWPALEKLKGKFRVVAVCNRTREKAEAFAKLVGAEKIYVDYRELMEKGGVEAVDILLPVEQNLEACAAAASFGLHVIAEKPIAADRDQAKIMLALESSYAKQCFMIAENYRYRRRYAKIKELIGEGKIGKAYSFQWNSMQNMGMENKYAQTAWRIHHQYEGGFITDGGIHNIAALRDIFGDLQFSGGYKKMVNPKIGRMDSLTAMFTSASGPSGVVNLYFSAAQPSANELRIWGETGTILLNDTRLSLWKATGIESEEDFSDDDGFVGEFEDFYQILTKGQKAKSNFSQAKADLDTILAAVEKAIWV